MEQRAPFIDDHGPAPFHSSCAGRLLEWNGASSWDVDTERALFHASSVAAVQRWHAHCSHDAMTPSLQPLIDAVLSSAHRALASEEEACALVAGLRWPGGITCPACAAPCTRTQADVTCEGKKRHQFTILVVTPLGSLRRPRVRAILLAIRAICCSRRSISARELARDVGMPHNTLWRHVHRLRKLLPRPSVIPLPVAAAVHVCGRRAGAQGHAVVAATNAMRAARARPKRPGRRLRIVGESVRTWLNGTFHGVSAGWLHRYLQEAAARLAYDAALVAGVLADALVTWRAPMFFDRHVRPVDATAVSSAA